jgi:hypothetical protein
MSYPGPTIGKDRPFFGVELKIARARMHAQAFRDSLQEWWDKKPISVRTEVSSDRREYKLILNEFGAIPPIELWGMQIGDCVHNLRSALDNLCYSAARLLNDPPRQPRSIQFPIFDDATAYHDRARATLGQLPALACELIEHFQPFKQPDPGAIKRHTLLYLNHLSNQDKHRIPQVALLCVNQSDHSQRITFESDAEAKAWVEALEMDLWAGPVWSGTILLTAKSKLPVGKGFGNVRIEAVPAVDTPTGIEAAAPLVEALGTQVTTVFDAFRLTFPNARD